MLCMERGDKSPDQIMQEWWCNLLTSCNMHWINPLLRILHSSHNTFSFERKIGFQCITAYAGWVKYTVSHAWWILIISDTCLSKCFCCQQAVMGEGEGRGQEDTLFGDWFSPLTNHLYFFRAQLKILNLSQANHIKSTCISKWLFARFIL